jgi:hypothetical protein
VDVHHQWDIVLALAVLIFRLALLLAILVRWIHRARQEHLHFYLLFLVSFGESYRACALLILDLKGEPSLKFLGLA